MKIFNKLFGRSEASAPPLANPHESGDRELVFQGDANPPLMIHPQLITHAFVALTHSDIHHSDTAAEKIADLNLAHRRGERRCWK